VIREAETRELVASLAALVRQFLGRAA